MIIKIIAISGPEAVKKYFTLEVNYKDESGKVAGKKLLSFNHPLVFNTMKAAQAGESYEIKTVKNDAGYWDWTEARKVEGGEVTKQAQTSTQQFAASSTDRFETKEERAQRQVLIVRQSSLSNAVETLAVGAKAVKPQDVLDLAAVYEEWVYSGRSYGSQVAETEPEIV